MENMLYHSHLGGIERPVRSFKSFIRIATPRASADKPLPPLPVYAQPAVSTDSPSSSTYYLPSPSTGYSLWEPPSTWDTDESYQTPSNSPFAIREYSPLLPEPPEDIAAMQAGPDLWQQSNHPFQQTPLDPIRERDMITPEIPARNPSRLSFGKDSRDTLPTISSRYSFSVHNERLQEEEGYEGGLGEHLDSNLPSPVDFMSALSSAEMETKASNSLAIGTPRNQGIIWGRQHQRSYSAQSDNPIYRDQQGNTLTKLKRGSNVLGGSPANLEYIEDRVGSQALSFAQNYHAILPDPCFDDRDRSPQDEPPEVPPKDQSITPRPLTWSKVSTPSPPADPPRRLNRPRLIPSSSSGGIRGRRKLSSWVNHQLRKVSHVGHRQRSASEPGMAVYSQLPDPEIERDLHYEARLANIFQNSKAVISFPFLRHQSEPKKPLVISNPIPHHDPYDYTNASVSTTPFELTTTVLRLPGGLAVVRPTPRPTPQPQTTDSPTSSLSDLSWPDFPASSPFRVDFSRRGSWQSARSLPQTRSSSLCGLHCSSPVPWAPSAPRSYSHSTVDLGTSAQDGMTPSSAHTTRRRSHNIGSPLAAPPSSPSIEQLPAEVACEGDRKLGLFERAKLVHDGWKNHQKEVKKEKMKQSIRLVGPADANDIAGYIRCAVDGRSSGDSGVAERWLAGGDAYGA
jgi:hypothetical protein